MGIYWHEIIDVSMIIYSITQTNSKWNQAFLSIIYSDKQIFWELHNFYPWKKASSVAYQHGNTNNELSDKHKIHENWSW